MAFAPPPSNTRFSNGSSGCGSSLGGTGGRWSVSTGGRCAGPRRATDTFQGWSLIRGVCTAEQVARRVRGGRRTSLAWASTDRTPRMIGCLLVASALAAPPPDIDLQAVERWEHAAETLLDLPGGCWEWVGRAS